MGFLFYPAFVPIFGVSINKRGNTPRERRNTQPSRNSKQGISLALYFHHGRDKSNEIKPQNVTNISSTMQI
ncbi:hypothetical protein HMPREF1572_01371 [Gardnerella vaginalis JCP7275]|nr:hypothetical protein HMPREF1572_01371 [Gardnerella vaginalis JCP7275]